MQNEQLFRHFWGDDWKVFMDVCNKHRSNGFIQSIEQQANRTLKIVNEPIIKELIKKHLNNK